MQEIYTRKILVEKNPLIRKVEIKKINPDSEENKAKYNKLNIIKNVIQDTIYLSKYYIEELNNSNYYNTFRCTITFIKTRWKKSILS